MALRFDISRLSPRVRYAFAIAITLAALALNFIPAISAQAFFFFYAAVALSARYCGFRPAIVSALLSAAFADYFFLPPRFAFTHTPADFAQVIGFILVCLVIANLARQRSEAEQSASEQRAQLAAIVESSDDAILSKTLEGTILSWNKGAERIYGYTPEEIIGRNVAMLAPPGYKDEIPAILERLRNKQTIEHLETHRQAKDGSLLQLSVTISPIFDSDGRVIAASAIARDIGERIKTEETLRKTEKLAAAGRLAATIAHEINNPLAAITNLLYLARKNPSLDGKAKRYLDLAQEELGRVAHIARQSLGFYRDTSIPGTVEISAALDEIVALYGRRIDSKGIHLETEYGPGLAIHAFPGEIRQLLSNLLVNAIDACGSGGQLRIRATSRNDWNHNRRSGVRITIADNGCGIPKPHLARLFEPFFTTKEDVGTGLGLWVSKGIVQRHGGSIRVRSSTRAGESGTVFSLFLSGVVPNSPVQRIA